MWTTLLLAKNLICINFFASYHLKDEVVLVILPPFEWFRFITFLVSYTSALLHLLILVSNHFWSQHHLLVEFGNSIWTPINFHHWHHKIGSLLVSMQDDCCQCYHSRRLGKSLHIPLSQCSAIPEYVNHLGFLTERFSSPPIHQCNASTFLAYLFTSYLFPSVQDFRKDEKPTQFLSILLKNFHIINITKNLKIFIYL